MDEVNGLVLQLNSLNTPHQITSYVCHNLVTIAILAHKYVADGIVILVLRHVQSSDTWRAMMDFSSFQEAR